jgi:D-erythronate 2-dehydrogenase
MAFSWLIGLLKRIDKYTKTLNLRHLLTTIVALKAALRPDATAASYTNARQYFMRVVITGGGGFLGTLLCNQLAKRKTLMGLSGQQQSIEQIVLLDRFFREPTEPDSTGPVISRAVCDIGDRDAVFSAVGTSPELAMFHLASMVSGECEERFDDAMRSNLDGGRNIFEATRSAGANAKNGRPRVVFASSIACFGGDLVPEQFSDESKFLPRTTYGMTKSICELMINDYSRRGFFDGRSARLPTVIVRPGKPNAAASSWASGMFREPLGGVDCALPIRREQRHPMTGYHTVIDSLIYLHELPADRLGGDRGVGLPAHTVTPKMAEQVIQEIAQSRGIKLGRIVDAFDARIQGIVDGWATAIDGRRAQRLGLPQPPPLRDIVEIYVTDFL